MCIRLDRSADNVEQYKVTKKTAKQAVSEARGLMYDGLYQRLDTKKRENIYRMTKRRERGRRGTSIKLNSLKRERERKMRDIIQVKCIKDETKRLIIKDEIKNRWWKKYFDKLFNEDSESSSIELDIYLYDLNRHFVPRIQESKVKDALKKMKGRKLIGSDGILNEVRRSLGDVAIVWLTKLFNLIFQSNKMLDK
jgi:hypothetical protein